MPITRVRDPSERLRPLGSGISKRRGTISEHYKLKLETSNVKVSSKYSKTARRSEPFQLQLTFDFEVVTFNL